MKIGHLTAFAAMVFAGSAAAAEFDNAATHEQARYGRLTCFVDHPHFGESPSWGSKSGAIKAAIRNWTNFTTFEYGAKWGQYALARNKAMDCSQSGSRWVCRTTAYPCRR